MGSVLPIFTLLTTVSAVVLGLIGYSFFTDTELPKFPENQFWGPLTLKGKVEDTTIRPFQINISENVLVDLKNRLKLEAATIDARIADPVENARFQWGFNKKLLKTVQNHWLNKYDWRAREVLMNKWPNFKTSISGIEIHFQHVKPTPQQSKKYKKGTRPLLLLHGWPGSFIEYQKIIPLLLEPKDSDINFEIVVPSLPGSGFSQAASRPGLGTPEMGQIFKTLMARMGHDKFYVQGGDWGSIIAADMATMYKDNIIGAHMTMCHSFHPRSVLKFGAVLALPQFFLDAEELPQFSPLSKFVMNLAREIAYIYLQATKPETLGISISFSPSGFASYILEKFSFFTNDSWVNKEDGGIFPHYDIDTLLDNVMVHWLGSSTTTSLRIYAEFLNPFTSTHYSLERVPVQVPVSCRNLPYEPLAQPKLVLDDKFPNMVRFSRAKTGGHFIAFEDPDSLASDIITSLNIIDKERQKVKA